MHMEATVTYMSYAGSELFAVLCITNQSKQRGKLINQKGEERTYDNCVMNRGLW